VNNSRRRRREDQVCMCVGMLYLFDVYDVLAAPTLSGWVCRNNPCGLSSCIRVPEWRRILISASAWWVAGILLANNAMIPSFTASMSSSWIPGYFSPCTPSSWRNNRKSPSPIIATRAPQHGCHGAAHPSSFAVRSSAGDLHQLHMSAHQPHHGFE
jgi:hypothetical protein